MSFYYAGHTYDIIKTAMTWDSASAYAASLGGHLAFINSAAENDYLYAAAQGDAQLLSSAPAAGDGGGAKYLWLGGSDAAVEGTWKWSDGSLLSGYTNWGSGALGVEPDNYAGLQDSMALGLQSWPQPSGGIGVAGKWNDLNPTNSLYFYVERDSIQGTSSNDVLAFSTTNIAAAGGTISIFGGTGDDTITAESGYNYLRGEDGNDSIIGGSGFDDINGNKGDDVITGGPGGDWLVGGQGNDLITSTGGTDILYGNLGNDTLNGGSDVDLVRGGQGDDVVTGGAANDWLSGDRGSDTLTGGTGADIFHTFGDAGIDRVTDFNLAEGDRVQLDPGTVYTVSQVGSDTVVNMTGGGQLILVGVQMASLTTGWIFGS